MLRLTCASVILFLALLLDPTPLSAQQAYSCFPRDSVLQRLKDTHEEEPAFTGVLSNGKLLIVYLNKKSGAFTLTIDVEPGVSCIVGSGEGFDAALEKDDPGT